MTIDLPLMTGTSAASGAVIGQQSTSANTGLTIPDSPSAGVTAKQAQDALFGYLQGMRALGRTKIDLNEAARALGLPVSVVLEAARALRPKGVEVA